MKSGFFSTDKYRPMALLTLVAYGVLSVVMLPSCSSASKPIGEEEMSLLMKEIMLAHHSAFLMEKGQPARVNPARAALVRDVLAHHNVTTEQFQEALDAYHQDPEALQRVYDRVLVLLSEENALQRGTLRTLPANRPMP